MHEAIGEWASREPRIRRVWASGNRVAIEPEPVADDGETFAVWMAHSRSWTDEVHARIDPGLELAWFDPDAGLLEPAELLYERGMWR